MPPLLFKPSFMLLLLAVFSVLAYGQTGSMQGTLTDSQGGVLTNAKVMAVDETKGVIARETTTKSDGSFQLLPLSRGTYTLKRPVQNVD